MGGAAGHTEAVGEVVVSGFQYGVGRGERDYDWPGSDGKAGESHGGRGLECEMHDGV